MNARLPIPPPADRGELASRADSTVALRDLHDLLMRTDAPVTADDLSGPCGASPAAILRRLRRLEALDLAVSWGDGSGSERWTGVRRAPLDLVPVAPMIKPSLPSLTRWTSTDRIAAQLGLPARYVRRFLRAELGRHVLAYDPDTDRWRLAGAYLPE